MPTPMIWPLRNRLRQSAFMQQRPKSAGSSPLPVVPVNLPWNSVSAHVGGSDASPPYPSVVHQLLPIPPTQFGFIGISRDSTGAALGGCTVKLYRERDDFAVEATVSDANGNYRFVTASMIETYYTRWYLAGSPDLAGTSKNTLVPG